MRTCLNCNSPVDENAKVCPMCGATLNDSQSVIVSDTKQDDNVSDLEYDYEKDVADNKVMAILSYLSFLCFVPLFGAKNSKFAYFHAVQGTILFAFEVALSIALSLVRSVFYVIFPVFLAYRIYVIFSLLLSGVFIALIVTGIINVVNGQMKKLPIIGDIIKLKK